MQLWKITQTWHTVWHLIRENGISLFVLYIAYCAYIPWHRKCCNLLIKRKLIHYVSVLWHKYLIFIFLPKMCRFLGVDELQYCRVFHWIISDNYNNESSVGQHWKLLIIIYIGWLFFMHPYIPCFIQTIWNIMCPSMK